MIWPFRRSLKRVAAGGSVPLCWATAVDGQDYLNLGDALSPVMVALVTGLPAHLVGAQSRESRMAAVGTIGHSFAGGEVWFWGTGSSRYVDPSAPRDEKRLFKHPSGSTFHLCATRGPISRAILGDGVKAPAPCYGDPVWLLPRFYRPKLEKKWELGVIIHLSDLNDRAFEAHPKAEHLRYELAEDERSSITLINTVTPVSPDALRERLDLILSCKRIVSTSLHGMVFAESYGIPCLYFSPRRGDPGVRAIELDPDGNLDLRFTDLYLGIGETVLQAYAQPRKLRTQWQDVIRAIDQVWEPKRFNADHLIETMPLEPNPVVPPETGSVFDLPMIRDLRLDYTTRSEPAKSRPARRMGRM